MTGTMTKAAMRMAGTTIALACLVLIGSAPIAMAQTNAPVPLVDLRPESAQPTDGASAELKIVPADETSTVVSLLVTGLVGQVGTQLRADFHVGPCLAGDIAVAGAHFNTSGQPPTMVDNSTEVWLDFSISQDGRAFVLIPLRFAIPPEAANSMVIHVRDAAQPNSTGEAWACLPILEQTAEQLQQRAQEAVGEQVVFGLDEVLGLAVTGPSMAGRLAVLGGTLVVTGAILVRSASVTRRRAVRR